MTASRARVMSGLIKMCDEGAKDYVHKTEDLGWNKGGILCSGEGGLELKGLPVFDYWQESDYLVADEGIQMESSYDLGTLKSVKTWLEKMGWYPEWQDAGTMMLWRIGN